MGSPSSTPTIEDLEQAVLENPENGEYAIRMSDMLRQLETPYLYRHQFWTTMTYRYADQISAQLVLAAFKDHSNRSPDHYFKLDSDYDMLLRSLLYRFPSSPIPKECYRFLDRAIKSPYATDTFIVDHLNTFFVSSSLVKVFDDEGRTRGTRIFGFACFAWAFTGTRPKHPCTSHDGSGRNADVGEILGN
jgi:hypothetical protein